MTQERRMVGAIFFIPAPESIILSVNLAALARSLIFFSPRMSAWLMENRPMRAQVTLMPSYRED